MITAAELKKLTDQAGYKLRSYSGRSMYGKRCPALTIDRQQSLAGVVAAIMVTCDDDDMREDMVDVFDDTKEDSMGLDSVLYFPSILWDLEEEEED